MTDRVVVVDSGFIAHLYRSGGVTSWDVLLTGNSRVVIPTHVCPSSYKMAQI